MKALDKNRSKKSKHGNSNRKLKYDYKWYGYESRKEMKKALKKPFNWDKFKFDKPIHTSQYKIPVVTNDEHKERANTPLFSKDELTRTDTLGKVTIFYGKPTTAHSLSTAGRKTTAQSGSESGNDADIDDDNVTNKVEMSKSNDNAIGNELFGVKLTAELSSILKNFNICTLLKMSRIPHAPDMRYAITSSIGLSDKQQLLFVVFASFLKTWWSNPNEKWILDEHIHVCSGGWEELACLTTEEQRELFGNNVKSMEGIADDIYNDQMLVLKELLSYYQAQEPGQYMIRQNGLYDGLESIGRCGHGWFKIWAGVWGSHIYNKEIAEKFCLNISKYISKKDSLRGMKALQHIARSAMSKLKSNIGETNAKYIILLILESLKIIHKIDVCEFIDLILPYTTTITTLIRFVDASCAKELSTAIERVDEYSRVLKLTLNNLILLGAFDWSEVLHDDGDIAAYWLLFLCATFAGIIKTVHSIECELYTIISSLTILENNENNTSHLYKCM